MLGEIYRPEPILVHTRVGSCKPALFYIASHMVEQPADAAYVERILKPARELGFPSWYLSQLESFRSAP